MKPLLPNKNRIVAKLSIIFALLLGVNQVNAQVLLTESFDGTTFVPVGWTDVLTSGGNTWTRVTAGTFPTQAPHSGAGEAKFNSWDVNGGIRSLMTPVLNFAAAGTKKVSFWMYRDNGYLSTPDKIDLMINTVNNLTGAVILGTVNRAINLAPIVAANGWYQYTFTVPSTYSTTTNYVFFRGTSAYGNHTYIDDISITNNWVPAANNCGIDYISNVTLSTINRSSTCDVFSPYATPNPTLTIGSTYTLSVSTGGDTEGARAWIDYNGDGLFNNAVGTELVLGSAYAGTNPTTYTIAVTIPALATPGVTRLRARCNYASAPVDATSFQTWGETEDYFVTIAPTPTVGPTAPPNDLCANAITLAIPSTTAGTTVNATLEAPAPPTCITTLGQPGVWYKVVGNGNKLGASLCATSAWDSKIFVYTGSCGAWTCVTGNDDVGPLCGGAAASGTWCSVPGVTYYILVTGYSGPNAFNIAITQTVTVAPIVAIAASSSTICAGAVSTMTASGASTYLWGGGLGTTTVAAVSPLATTVYTVTGTNQCASPNSITFTVTVNASPTITVNSGAVCAGNSFTMAAAGASTYSYSGGSAIVAPASNTSYTVTGSNAFGCIGSAVSTVTVNALPIITVNSGSICTGQSFTMIPSGASTYTYSSGSAVVAPSTNTFYLVTGTSAAGCVGSSGAVSSVVVNAIPVVTVNSGSICNGSSFTMIPGGASTYTYSSGSAVVAPTTNTSYTVTGASAAGCLGAALSSVTVNAVPVISVNSGTICSGGSFTMVPAGAFSYTYSGGSAVVAPTTNTTYTVTGSSAAGCLGLSGALSAVTVNALPIITVNSGSICSGNSFTMAPSGASTYTYSGGSSVVSPLTNSSYTVTGTSAAGCLGLSSAVSSVTVNANPVVTVSSGSICNGLSYTMIPGGASTYIYSSGSAIVAPTANTSYTVTGTNLAGCTNTAVSSVTVNANPVVTVNSGAICSGASFTMVPAGASTYVYTGGSAVVSPTANTSYTVTGTNAAGCTANAVSSLTVNALPILSVTSGSICSGNSFTMVPTGATTYTYSGGSAIVSPSVTTSYTVSGSNAAGCISSIVKTITVSATPVIVASSGAVCTGGSFTISPTGATTYTYSSGSSVVSPTATTSYTVSGSSATGCQSSAVVTVSVNPTLAFSANSGSVCSGSTFTMMPSGATSYTYSSGTAAVTPTATTTYTIVGVNSVGCFGTQICTVTVNALPVVSATASSTIICSGVSVVLTASTTATSYTWNTGATTMSVSVSPTITSTYTVNVSNAASCSASSMVMITVSTCTGINELTENSISIYPNPSFGFVKIILTTQLVNNSSIAIYDALGKLILTQELGNEINTLNISELKNGMYTYKVLNNSNIVKIGKIVKQ